MITKSGFDSGVAGDDPVNSSSEVESEVLEALATVQSANDGYKRTFDVVLIIVGHLILFPVLVLLWTFVPLAIWLEDRGPVFYRQLRMGKGGREFTVVKFRTMIRDAERSTGPVLTFSGDRRITRVGSALRFLYLDEVPQVVNILKGEMSLVGPRPERPVLMSRIMTGLPEFYLRLRARPGLTGLAQIRGSYNPPQVNKLRYDNLYIEQMSPLLDLKLIGLTLVLVFLLRPIRQFVRVLRRR